MNVPWLQPHEQQLNESLTHDRLGHAPLILGPAGLGKRKLARWLTARILCLSPSAGQPCGNCRSCTLLASGTHPDLFIAAIPEDKTQLTVDVIRALTQGLQLTPSMGPTRVGLVEEADQMNENAANALLKTLEEPSSQAWLVLVSDDPDSLPPTVLSRCQKIPVHPPQPEDTRTWLQGQATNVTEADIALALDAAGGAPLRAQALLTENGLEFGREVRRVLLESARGQLPTPAMLEAWSIRPLETWQWLSHWIRQFMGSALMPGDAELDFINPVALSELWQQALQGRAMARTSIRTDLLLGKWLLEWSALFDRQS
ncbi:MAG: DNA polymerase III subunit delta' [Wenzhouxiangella sp.]|jgi:DNA polymerase-3 subunit delta'|nr:DNA polymerase III subunit delta' [Wenzhouxiangella sp.]